MKHYCKDNNQLVSCEVIKTINLFIIKIHLVVFKTIVYRDGIYSREETTCKYKVDWNVFSKL